jgi:hypothetical protein
VNTHLAGVNTHPVGVNTHLAGAGGPLVLPFRSLTPLTPLTPLTLLSARPVRYNDDHSLSEEEEEEEEDVDMGLSDDDGAVVASRTRTARADPGVRSARRRPNTAVESGESYTHAHRC